jgi:2-polyprenyl-3-methyl-5-hydroxy-6-metoxy-1,4-benzoquinol methylase
MSVRIDPENNETRALFDLVDFTGRRVLEIGCGNGRLTWRYARKAAHVTAIDPYADWIAQAQEALPAELHHRIEFHAMALADFAAAGEPSAFDVVLLSWSL